jgi:hypothetical protein
VNFSVNNFGLAAFDISFPSLEVLTEKKINPSPSDAWRDAHSHRKAIAGIRVVIS